MSDRKASGGSDGGSWPESVPLALPSSISADPKIVSCPFHVGGGGEGVSPGDGGRRQAVLLPVVSGSRWWRWRGFLLPHP